MNKRCMGSRRSRGEESVDIALESDVIDVDFKRFPTAAG
jgi:hypothetical protein